MEDKVKVFLESGRLEAYIYGILEPSAQEEVIRFIKNHPEVQKEYLDLQDQLEKISIQQAIKAPDGLKAEILQALPEKSLYTAPIGTSWSKYIAIAGLAASIILAWGWYDVQTKLQEERVGYELLSANCEQREKQIESLKERNAFLSSDQTQRLEMQGNLLAPDFKANIFLNEALEKIIITPLNRVKLPENKCLQIWGDLNGEMIPIAVLDDLDKEEYNLNLSQDFASLNITIEEKTEDGKGQDHPDVSQLISSVAI